MMTKNNALKIGIIIGSTREGRVSPQVGAWVKAQSQIRPATYEIVDIADYKLPLLGESGDYSGIPKWQAKIAELDGFVFIAQEYNHGLAASLKNAIDYLRDEWHNKAAGIVSYGSIGGARAAEHLRGVFGELQIADVRTQVLLSLFTDFENGTTFKPQDLHLTNLNTLLNEVEQWATALKTIR